MKRRKTRGLAGLDTAIILIAFIITAAVLAYVAVNMGLFVTQKAKTTINKGEETASTALSLSGNVLYAVNYPTNTKSYWMYFTVSPSSGVSSVDLSPSTTAISFTAASRGVSLSNIYQFSLLSVLPSQVNNKVQVKLGTSIINLTLAFSSNSAGQTYVYYSDPNYALLALNYTLGQEVKGGQLTSSPLYIISNTSIVASKPWLKNDNVFTFNISVNGTEVEYYAYVNKTFAFTYPVSGFPLAGSDIAPAGSVIGVMILFGPGEATNVFQYETVTIQITPNIGSPLTISQYIYQPDGKVTVIG